MLLAQRCKSCHARLRSSDISCLFLQQLTSCPRCLRPQRLESLGALAVLITTLHLPPRLTGASAGGPPATAGDRQRQRQQHHVRPFPALLLNAIMLILHNYAAHCNSAL